VSLQDELAREVGAEPKIRWGGLGQLDVLIDGAVVFSKKALQRMPEPGEVVRLARGRR
jgi:hypothetical protein